MAFRGNSRNSDKRRLKNLTKLLCLKEKEFVDSLAKIQKQ